MIVKEFNKRLEEYRAERDKEAERIRLEREAAVAEYEKRVEIERLERE